MNFFLSLSLSLNQLKMPQHLVRKRMDLNDYLSLCAFLPLQSSRYKEFMGKFGSFARDGASLTLQRNSTKRRLLKVKRHHHTI